MNLLNNIRKLKYLNKYLILFLILIFFSTCNIIKKIRTKEKQNHWYVIQNFEKGKSYDIYYIRDSVYEVYYRIEPKINHHYLQAYGSYQFFPSNSNGYIVFKDSIVYQPSIVIKSEWSYDKNTSDSIILKLNKPLMKLYFVNLNLINSIDTFNVSFLRWSLKRPLEVKFQKGGYSSFYVTYEDFNDKRNSFYSKNEPLIVKDSNNIVNISLLSKYRSYEQVPGRKNMSGDTAFYLDKNRIFLTNYLGFRIKQELIGVSEKHIKKKYPFLYNLKYGE